MTTGGPVQIPTGSDNVAYIYQERTDQSGRPLFGGGGGGTFDDMERRVKALEDGLQRIEGKIDKLADSFVASREASTRTLSDFKETTAKSFGDLKEANAKSFSAVNEKLTSLEEVVKTRAPLSDLSFLRGKVDNLPTTLQLGGFVVAIITATGLLRWFGH